MQPAGTTDKHHKHQQYDFTFDAQTHEYTCRSKEGDKINATDFVVGSNIDYQVKGNKGKVKGSTGKEVSCTIVRVADLPAAQRQHNKHCLCPAATSGSDSGIND